jgi:hypothetical protein
MLLSIIKSLNQCLLIKQKKDDSNIGTCEVFLDTLNMNPCINDGECETVSSDRFKCKCPPGFMGYRCEKIDRCYGVDCGMNGFCINQPDSSPIPHVCYCSGGKRFGISCDKIEETEINPCTNRSIDFYPTKLNPQLFIQCEGNINHIRNCLHPLVYSHSKRECNWSNDLSPNSVENFQNRVMIDTKPAVFNFQERTVPSM